MSWVHGALDIAGMTPGIGAVADIANAGIYALEGDWGNAAIASAAAIPIVGQGATAAKLAKKGIQASKQGAKQGAKQGFKQQAKQFGKEAAGSTALQTGVGFAVNSAENIKSKVDDTIRNMEPTVGANIKRYLDQNNVDGNMLVALMVAGLGITAMLYRKKREVKSNLRKR